MRLGLGATCLLTLSVIAEDASASGPEAAAKVMPPPAAVSPGESGADAAAAIRAARADLDAMVATLLREQAETQPPQSGIQVEVTPSLLTSDAPRAADPV